MIRRSWCAFFVLWLFVPIASASDFGLTNPAVSDFAEFQSNPLSTDNFSRKHPAFDDRALPTSRRAEEQPIRQVSTFGEPVNDPFPMVVQPMLPLPHAQASQHFPTDWGTAVPVMPYNPLVAQNNVIPYDPNTFEHVNPHFMMQDMQNMYLAQQQFSQQQFVQHPLQFQQGYMMPQTSPFINPYADLHMQFGFTDPYGGMWSPQMGHSMGHQNMPDHSAMYQAFFAHEMARQQAAEAQTRASNTGNREGGGTSTITPQEPEWTLNNLVPLRVSSPLGETLLVGAKTLSPFVTPTGPDKGVGMPLVNRSWLDHPYYFGGFVGHMSGSELVDKMIDQKGGGTGGLLFGYNFNDYWGLESRLHFASIDIHDTDYARQLFELSYLAQFPGQPVPVQTTRTSELTILDAAVHYYPLGNAKWRPYFKYGLGVGRQRFTNTFGYENKADIVTMPLGIGMRYWWNERLAIQADLLDNVVFASSIAKTQHNISFTIGLTYAFGSGRTKNPIHYWPATPSMGSQW